MRKNRKSISMSKLTLRRRSRLGVELFQLFLLPYKNRVEAKIGWETCRGVGLEAQKGAKAHFWFEKRLRRDLPGAGPNRSCYQLIPAVGVLRGGGAPPHARPCGGFSRPGGPCEGSGGGGGAAQENQNKIFFRLVFSN